MKTPRHKEYHTRYFTIYVQFPDGEEWCAQVPFIQDLSFQLKQTKWNPDICRKLLKHGEAHWKDAHNGVTHRVVVDDVTRPRKWGKNGMR